MAVEQRIYRIRFKMMALFSLLNQKNTALLSLSNGAEIAFGAELLLEDLAKELSELGAKYKKDQKEKALINDYLQRCLEFARQNL